MRARGPRSLIGRLGLWAAILVAVSVPLFWVLFSAAVETVSRDVVDTRILEFADQVRGYWASLEAPADAAGLGPAPAGDADVPTPGLGGADVEWVYQISRGGEVAARSALLSLYDASFPRRLREPNPAFRLTDVEMPFGAFRIAERVVAEPVPFATAGATVPVHVHYLAGLTQQRYRSYVAEHAQRLRGLALLAAVPVSLVLLGMLAFIVLTLRRHLGTVNTALQRYEVGETESIDGRFPTELQSLVDRINALLGQNARLVARTRKYVSKIAHDINHPISIMKNALARGGGEGSSGDLLGRQVDRMTGLVDRYASLARAIGPEGTVGRLTPVDALLTDVAEGFSILYRRTPVAIDTDCAPGLVAPFPRHDLEAMVSNLVSNAHKFAASRIRLSGELADGRLVLSVADDGPGVPPEKRDMILNWGERLDEAPPGTGFGLSIVRDIADLYQGRVGLDVSADLGGLRATIELPLETPAPRAASGGQRRADAD